jgi:hypothetical protein
MAVKYKFKLTEHLLRMIGVCADCQRQAKVGGKDLSAHAARNTHT